MVMNVVFLAQTYIETLFLSRLAPGEVLGWYGAARNISGTLLMAGNILVTASFPRLSRTASDPVSFKREVSTALRPVLALAVLAMVGTYLFADLAIGMIFGKGTFGPAVLVLQILGPTLFLIFVDMMLGIVALAAGKARPITAYKFAALLLAAALGYPLIRLTQDQMGNGAIGAVAAFAVSELFMVFAFVRLVPRGVLDRTVWLDLLRALVCGGASVLAVRLLPWDFALITLPLCLLVFAGMARVTGLIRPSDRELLAALLKR
jgi:O-antigen/teichoic acid export membrane protein